MIKRYSEDVSEISPYKTISTTILSETQNRIIYQFSFSSNLLYDKIWHIYKSEFMKT